MTHEQDKVEVEEETLLDLGTASEETQGSFAYGFEQDDPFILRD